MVFLIHCVWNTYSNKTGWCLGEAVSFRIHIEISDQIEFFLIMSKGAGLFQKLSVLLFLSAVDHLSKKLEYFRFTTFSEFFEDMESIEEMISMPNSFFFKFFESITKRLFLICHNGFRLFSHNRKPLSKNIAIQFFWLIIRNDKSINKNFSALGSPRKNSN